ncbi:MAG: A/G-specific adenine glycosylase [Zetaproteobacteria bacterium]|nr:A/G-specific adenine glycosylase [Zetaproteobacteria bacterium]
MLLFTRHQLLTRWYEQHARILPWRETRQPYPIWVSEIMLQQTQVKTVLPRFVDWLTQFPTITTVAQATEDQIMKAWEGLGYYRRARLLHQSAQHLEQHYQSIFPSNFDDILSLPGIGRSTAGAIASFCFEQYTPVLDGNVKRVLRRWYGEENCAEKVLWQRAQQAIDIAVMPSLWNQAMMELGATLCKPRNPLCNQCPIQAHCDNAFQDSVQKKSKNCATIKNVYWQVHLYHDEHLGLWLHQRPRNGIWGALWSPPITELQEEPAVQPDHIHLLTHRRLHLYAAHHPSKTQPTHGSGTWQKEWHTLALPTGIRQLFQKLNM